MNLLDDFYCEYYSDSISILSLANYHPKKKCFFLDRDGVLIKDVHHIDSPKKVQLCNNIKNFLECLKHNEFDLVVVTNQSSLSRGIISYDDYRDITAQMLSFLPVELYPELILASFHLPNNDSNLDNFDWRKPDTGMFNYAIKKYKYDVKKSMMIGDKLTDLLPANNCKLSELFYISSALHIEEKKKIELWNFNNKDKIKIIKNLVYSEIFKN